MPTRDERGILKYGEVYFDGAYVGTANGIEITDYIEDPAGREYLRGCIDTSNWRAAMSVTLKFKMITYLKLCGLWDWVKTNCPNKRLVYLMDHGKNTRVRLKNYRRAAQEIGKYII